MNRFLTVAVAVAALCMALPAFAQAKKEGGKASPKSAEPAQKNYDFEGDVVEASFLRPDQGVAEVVRLDEGPSLIKVRTDFVDEILKSAEDL